MKLNSINLPNGMVMTKNSINAIADFIGRTYETGLPITIEQIIQEYHILKQNNELYKLFEYPENTYEEDEEQRIKNLIDSELQKSKSHIKLGINTTKLIQNLNENDPIIKLIKIKIIHNTYLMLLCKSKTANNEIESILRAYPELNDYASNIAGKIENI